MLESILWPEGPIWCHCGTVNHAYKTKRPGVFRCAEKGCRKDFTVTMKTVMERSHIALHKWLQAFHLMTSAARRAFPRISCTGPSRWGYEAAWFMAHRIRESMRAWGPEPSWAAAARSWRPTKPTSVALQGQLVHRGGGFVIRSPCLTLVERGGSARSFHIERLDHWPAAANHRANVGRECSLDDR